MPRDERDSAVPVVGAERVTADAGGGVLRRLHNRTVQAAERGVRYARSRRQAGGANAATLTDGAAGNPSATDRYPAHDDCRAANGYHALAHSTAGHRDGAAGTESPSTHADGPSALADAASADSDRATADGHACAIPYARPAGAPGTRPVWADCGGVGVQTTALPHRGAGRHR